MSEATGLAAMAWQRARSDDDFAAFLPQFMDAHASPLMQTLALGGVFIGIACCTDLMYVLTASLVAPRLNRAAQHAGQPARGYVLHHFGCAHGYRYAARALSHCRVADGSRNVSRAGHNQSQRFIIFEFFQALSKNWLACTAYGARLSICPSWLTQPLSQSHYTHEPCGKKSRHRLFL